MSNNLSLEVERIQQELEKVNDAKSVLTRLKYLYRSEVLLENLVFDIEYGNQSLDGIEVTPR